MVQYDPSTRDLRTISMHMYESDDVRDGKMQSRQGMRVRVDPDRRCACALAFSSKLAILPLSRGDTATAAAAAAAATTKKGGISTTTTTAVDDASVRETVAATATATTTTTTTAITTTTTTGAAVSDAAQRQVFLTWLLDLSTLEQPIVNVVDYAWLQGYHVPTLLIVHERKPTWSGSFAARKDTIAVTALGLSLESRSVTVVWNRSQLPSDCCRLTCLPPPVGGALLFGANCLLYLDQAMSYGASLNAHSLKVTGAGLKVQDDCVLALDGCRVTVWGNDRLLLSLRTGDIYLLQLKCEGRDVRGFRFTRLATSVLTSDMCRLGTDHLFLGSRLGNSLLLRVSESGTTTTTTTTASSNNSAISTSAAAADAAASSMDDEFGGDGPPTKRVKDEEQFDNVADLEDLSIYGLAAPEAASVASRLKLKVCDSLSNIGPCGKATVGLPDGLDLTEVRSVKQYDLVVPSGHGKNGGVSVLHRSFQPQSIMATDAISNCVAQWAVYAPDVEEDENMTAAISETSEQARTSTAAAVAAAESHDTKGAANGKDRENKPHSYLVLSQDRESLVLGTEGEELQELKDAAFCTDTRTIYAGNVCGHRYIIQVTKYTVFVLDCGTVVHHLPIEGGAAIVQAVAADPVVALLLSTGRLLVVSVGADGKITKLETQMPEEKGAVVEACSLLTDSSGIFAQFHASSGASSTTGTVDAPASGENKSVNSSGDGGSGAYVSAATVDEEDALLYGGMDEEEDMLYGNDDGGGAAQATGSTAGSEDATTGEGLRGEGAEAGEATTAAASGVGSASKTRSWLIVCMQSGALRVYSLPKFELCFEERNFNLSPRLLTDSLVGVEESSTAAITTTTTTTATNSTGTTTTTTNTTNAATSLSSPATKPSSSSSSASGAGSKKVVEDPSVCEIVAFGFGAGAKPHIVALLDTDALLVYEAFTFVRESSDPTAAAHDGRLATRFRRVEHDFLLQESLSFKRARKEATGKRGKSSKPDKKRSRLKRVAYQPQRLRPFVSVAGCDGIFVCGERPLWIMAGHDRKALRFHPMYSRGSVQAFCEFHNDNCDHGFVYSTSKGVLHIATSQPGVTYHTPWLTRRLPMKTTVAEVSYHDETGVYAVVTHSKYPAVYAPKMSNDKEDEELERVPLVRDPRAIPPQEAAYSMHLLSPMDWSIVPGTTIDIGEYNHVTAFTIARLLSPAHVSGFKNYVAVGTTSVHTEEVSQRGEIVIYDVRTVAPEPGQPTTKNKWKRLASMSAKGPISSLGTVNGFLVGSVGERGGAKFYVWHLEAGERLVPIAYAGGQIYSNCVLSIKNFLLAGDVYAGPQLMLFSAEQERDEKKHGQTHITAQITQIGSDLRPTETYAIAFGIYDDQLRMLVTDGDSALTVLNCVCDDSETSGGRKLVRCGIYNMGSRTISLTRLRCPPVQSRPGVFPQQSRRHYTYYTTLDGSLGCVVPVPEMSFRRLNMLQAKLTTGLQHAAGLNPRAYRAPRPKGAKVAGYARGITATKRIVLDGKLLLQYVGLGVVEQREFARSIGTTPEQILDDLLSIQNHTQHF